MGKKPLTPEGAALKSISDYLALCHLGTVRRANVGMARMGEKASNHPWAKDTRRVVRFGEVGESDLRLELAGSTRTVFIEVKRPGWTAPKQPAPEASASTREKFKHHQEQVQFQARQIARGHYAFFARSAFEVYQRLTDAGFLDLPMPQEVQAAPKAPTTRPKPSRGILRAAKGTI